jgi:ketosteroid isomerase-like protein
MNDMELVELRDSIRHFSEAWAAGDRSVLEMLTSESYTHTDFGGEFYDRAGWLDYVGRRHGQPTRIDFEDLQVRSLGDLAIVNGVNAIHWHGGDEDAPFDQRIRMTQVWRKVDGQWKREAFQATLIN